MNHFKRVGSYIPSFFKGQWEEGLWCPITKPTDSWIFRNTYFQTGLKFWPYDRTCHLQQCDHCQLPSLHPTQITWTGQHEQTSPMSWVTLVSTVVMFAVLCGAVKGTRGWGEQDCVMDYFVFLGCYLCSHECVCLCFCVCVYCNGQGEQARFVQGEKEVCFSQAPVKISHSVIQNLHFTHFHSV